jgi:hypothetical protein
MIKEKNYSIIHCVIYPFDVMVSFETDFVKFKKTLQPKLPNDIWHEIDNFNTTDYNARTIMFSNKTTCIRFLNYNKGIVAHEIFHAVDFVMNDIGMKLTEESDEAYAYFVQYLTDQIYFRFKKRLK